MISLWNILLPTIESYPIEDIEIKDRSISFKTYNIPYTNTDIYSITYDPISLICTISIHKGDYESILLRLKDDIIHHISLSIYNDILDMIDINGIKHVSVCDDTVILSIPTEKHILSLSDLTYETEHDMDKGMYSITIYHSNYIEIVEHLYDLYISSCIRY